LKSEIDGQPNQGERDTNTKKRRKIPWWWLRQREPVARFTAWLVIVTAILSIATIASVVALIVTDHTLKDTARRQLRAYLYVDPLSFGPVGADAAIGPTIIIRSAGVTPAYKLRLAATIEIGEFPLPNKSELSDPFNRDGEGVLKKSYPILYGNDGVIREPITVKFSQKAIDLLKIDHHRLYVFGGVKYLDIFGVERRYDFCFSFNADPDSPIKAAQEDGCDNYNKPG
jgi:hypothetical protein